MESLTELTERVQADIAEAFYENAQINAKASNGLLVAYEPDFRRFPYQSLSIQHDRRMVKGHPISPEDAFDVAEVVDKRCRGLERSFKEADDENGVITTAEQLVDAGSNVIFGTDHLEIVDIAYFACGMSATLRKKGAQHRSGLILSKAASDYMGVDIKNLATEKLPFEFIKSYLGTLGLEVLEDGTIPVRNFLKLAVDLQFLTIPNTESFSGLRDMQQDAIRLHNAEVKSDITSQMSKRRLKARPPLALYVAMPGTKTKKLDTAQYWQNMQIPSYHRTIPEHLPTNVDDIDVIGKFADKVTDFTSGALAFASTMRLRNNERPTVKVDTSPIHIDTVERLNTFAGKLIRLVDSVDGTTSVYDMNDRDRRLPTKKS